MSTEFDVKKHLIKIKGKDYLPVAARLVWFRLEHPDWSILTESLSIQPDQAIFRATIMNSEGRIIAIATKMETKAGWQDYVEKAETGSIGRALALSGYGTQFAPELEEGERIVDSPQATSSKATTTVGQAARERAGLGRNEPTPAQIKDIHVAASHLWGKNDAGLESYKEWLEAEYGVKSSKGLAPGQCAEAIEKINILIAEYQEEAA